jgi:hypothetical protein
VDSKTRERLAEVLKLAGNVPAAAARARGDGGEGEAAHLYFTLETADFIPECTVTAPPQIQRHKGDLDPLWDKGPISGGKWPTKIVAAILTYLPFVVLGGLALGLAIYGTFLLVTGRQPKMHGIGWLIGAGFMALLTLYGLLGMNLVLAFLTVAAAAASVYGLVANKNVSATAILMLVCGMLWLGRVFIGPGLTDAASKQAVFSAVMMIVVALLSLEWLSRKLLKLA